MCALSAIGGALICVLAQEMLHYLHKSLYFPGVAQVRIFKACACVGFSAVCVETGGACARALFAAGRNDAACPRTYAVCGSGAATATVVTAAAAANGNATYFFCHREGQLPADLLLQLPLLPPVAK